MKKKNTSAKKPANRRVRVTVWKSAEWDTPLVLEGTRKQTTARAISYLARGSKSTLVGQPSTMTREALNALPEHGG